MNKEYISSKRKRNRSLVSSINSSHCSNNLVRSKIRNRKFQDTLKPYLEPFLSFKVESFGFITEIC